MNAPAPRSQPDIVGRLRSACDGHPHAKIEWPHRILHEAADEIASLKSQVERMTAHGAAQTALAWSASTHDEIIKRLMAGVGMPNSTSLYVAFKQFANELHALAHDTSPVPSAQCVPLNKKTRCEECNLLVPCADPACPNAALTSTDRGSAAE